MSLNFDAQINLDIEPFIASINRAQQAMKSLDDQIDSLNKGKGAAIANATSGMQARKQASAAAIRSMVQEEAVARKLSATDQANAKVEWQAEMMRQKALDARLKDHQTISTVYDQEIEREAKARKAASDSIKQQMQADSDMRRLHTQALAMNERFDAARAAKAASENNVRNLARERYALYDVAAAYQQVSQAAFTATAAMAGTAISYERSFANVRRTTEFTSRTVGEAARVMQYSLTQVAAQIPVSFGKITEIATIGNQLGIAQGKLVSFSKTVSQFAATTGMTTEATAMGFGRIGELLNEQDYNKLGSSIAYAGVKAVATEEQIVSVTKEIATTAKMAKFTTPEVVGLATALSSVGIAPEAARGSIMRTFAGINEAVGAGGAKLQNYAAIAGMSAEDFARSWQTNGQKAFGSFLSGLQSMSASGQNLDSVLRSIGLKNVRDIQTIQKLGDNYNVYADSVQNANTAFQEGTFLSEAYSTIQDTVAAKIELLRNNIDNLMATMGQGATGEFFKAILDGINAMLQRMNEVARSPLGQVIGPIVLGFTTLVGAIAALNATLALGKAAMYAYATATNVGGASLGKLTTAAIAGRVGLQMLGTAFKSIPWIAGISLAIEGFNLLADSMTPVTQKAENILNGFAGLQDAVTSDTQALGEYAKAHNMSMQEAAKANGVYLLSTEAIKGNDQAAQDAIDAHNGLLLITGQEPDAFNASTGAIGSQTLAIGANTKAWIRNAMASSAGFQEIAKNKDAMAVLTAGGYNLDDALAAKTSGKLSQYFEKVLKVTKDKLKMKPGDIGFDTKTYTQMKNASGAIKTLEDTIAGTVDETILLGLGADTATKKIGNTGTTGSSAINKLTDATKKAKTAIRTVVDYASDLSSIFKRIDDISFSKQTGLDEITSQWKSMKDAAKSAADAIKKAQESIDTLTADKGILEYQLSVAVRYGDEKRAADLRAKIAEKTTAIADAETEKKKAQDEASVSLEKGTDAGIRNRAALISMLGKYQDYISALAATGVKGNALTKEIEAQKKAFIDQATQLGFNATDLDAYTKQFDQYAFAVKTTPRDVNVEFKATKDPVFNAVQEYLAKEQKLNVKVVMNNAGVLNTVGGTTLNLGSSSGSSAGAGSSGAGYSPSVATTTVAPDTSGKTQTTAALKALMNESIRLQTLMKSPSMSYSGAIGLSKKVESVQALYKELSNIQKQMNSTSGFSMQALAQMDARRLQIISDVAAKKFSSGGAVWGVGSGTSDSIPAMLSNGEFVMRASAVKTYGLDFMNSLNQAKVGFQFAGAGAAGASGNSQMVYLSPDDRALLRAAIDRPVNLYSDNTRLASSTNAGNVALAQRGVN